MKQFVSLSVSRILAWADAFYERTGSWPNRTSGRIGRNVPFTWRTIDRALREGSHGLPGGFSLACLLENEREVPYAKPALTEEDILSWADGHFQRTGAWPSAKSGQVFDEPQETWSALNSSLKKGSRGLPGGSSLSRLLAEKRGKRPKTYRPPLSSEMILSWADDYFQRKGHWPRVQSGHIPGTRETWHRIHSALVAGNRGLPGGSSLSRFLAEHRGVRNSKNLPDLSEEQVLAWCDAHYQRFGSWPKRRIDDPIPEAPGETWATVFDAFSRGNRGLRQPMSLAQLLVEKRGARIHRHEPQLTVPQILAWADLHHERTGDWPTSSSRAPVLGAPGENWNAINSALQQGVRGLTGGSTLAELLVKHRGIRRQGYLPLLRPRRIRAWAKAHFRRTGQWPTDKSGPIVDAPGETWLGVDMALRKGHRGLSGASSLAKLLAAVKSGNPQ